MERLLARLRSDGGFGLVELLVAMVLLNIALLALLAAFVNGVNTMRRSSNVSTASVLADTQMELYRALPYSMIGLDPSTIPGTEPYTTDTAYSASQVSQVCGQANCNASQTVTGPDHSSYRIDTYVVFMTPTDARPTKQVTVVVRDTTHLSGAALARRASLFDESTGL